MKPRQLAWALPIVLTLMALASSAGAVTPSAHPSAAGATTVPHPVKGLVMNCSSRVTCAFVFNTTAGKGWANATVSRTTSSLTMALQLPGEAKASYNLTYVTYIARLTGTYTYWTVGNFLGTDVNSGHVVYGTTNTNYTITCHGTGRGCTYTYKTDNGTIVVRFTNAEITSTSLACSPTFTHPGNKVTCTVTVLNGWNATNYPNGTVHISSGGSGGTLTNKGACALSSKGNCTFTYRPGDNTCGLVTLLARYPGNAAFYRSSGSIQINVYVNGGC